MRENVRSKARKRALLILPAILVTVAIALSMAQAAVTLSIQLATNKFSYNQGSTVVVRASALNGATRLSSSSISSATVTIKDPSGAVKVNAASMSKDSATGLCSYSYALPSTAPKGVWVATVSIRDSGGNGGTASINFKVRAPVPNHATLFSSYDGPRTCINCHNKQANDMFNSVHYQWQGDTSKAIELAAAGSKASKLGGINDYCIWPDANWLTIFNKTDGTKGPGGCAVCHAGLGLKPSATVSQQQLENIDCLMCHAPGYSRKVVANADGTFSLTAADGVDVLKAAQGVTRPTRETCMRCHEKSGGGDNYKRGDLESTIKSCPKSYDVHMGTDGQNFACQDCHQTENHKMAGRGSDMRALDSATKLSCESCHTAIPHRSTNKGYADLNRHTEKVDCTVCHIPTFAKSVPTDMLRDWRHMELDEAKKLYDPTIVKGSNVKPVYAWFNGLSHFYKFKDPVSLDSRGVQKMSWPDGSFADDKAKIHAFKLHKGIQPMESTTRQLLPVKNKIAFETGNVDEAIKQGAVAAGMQYAGHKFVDTERYQGIYHGVGPKSTALSCSNQPCHGNETRIPFSSLGYGRRGSDSQLCDVCHSLKSNPGFTRVHSKHRKSPRSCTACHGSGYPLKESKATLCDNCHGYKSTSDVNKLHAKHVKDKRLDCGNCHTFTGGGLVRK